MKNPVVALGTFDGVHLGHQKIINSAGQYAQRKNFPCWVLTFDPHPQQLISPQRGLQLLTTVYERKKLFKKLGVNKVLVFKFTPHLQKLKAEEFVEKYLVKKLKVRAVFVGFDYAFGNQRSGDVSLLKRLGKKFGFSVVVISPVKMNHFAIKSKIIRELISHGNFSQALRFLGHPYPLSGKVIQGSGRGKFLGYPTANLSIDQDKLIPAHGVYRGKVLLAGKTYPGIINIGSRPTFAEEQVAVEVHILGFKKNIYGNFIWLDLEKKLREEIHFSDVEDLKKQIRRDIAKVKKVC